MMNILMTYSALIVSRLFIALEVSLFIFNENVKARVIVQYVSPLSSPFQYDDNNDDNYEDKYYGSQRSSYSRDVVWCLRKKTVAVSFMKIL